MVGGQTETEGGGRGRHKKETEGDNETERTGSSSSQVHVSRILKVRNLKPLSLFVFFFALTRERIFIKTHTIESRGVTGPAG